VQDGSEDGSDNDSDSEAPAPEALARYLAIRRYTATGGAGLTAAAAGTSTNTMKTSHGTRDDLLYFTYTFCRLLLLLCLNHPATSAKTSCFCAVHLPRSFVDLDTSRYHNIS